MLNNTYTWSHTRGNAVVPSRWQATDLALYLQDARSTY